MSSEHAKTKTKPKTVKCSFCEKEVDEQQAIYGKTPKLVICEDCLEICNSIKRDRAPAKAQAKPKKIPNPKEIKALLDEHVVDQEMAKKVVAVAVYNHYKRVFMANPDGVRIDKANVMLLGPTGCGKTLIARTVAEMLHVPLVVADATSLTQAGYVGRSVEDVLRQLVDEADGDVELAQRGVVFIDEIDKIAGHGDLGGLDVAGEAVQQSLLKMVEGAVIDLGESVHSAFDMPEQMFIDTSNILFLFGGAFAGLEDIVAKRLNKGVMGFGSDTRTKVKADGQLLRLATHDDLVEFGMIPEFMGRVQIIVALHALTEEALVRVLREPKNSLVKQYQTLLDLDGVKLDFDDDALTKIAAMATKRKTGARGLRSIIEDTMLDVMYSVPSSRKKHVTVHADDIVDCYALS